MQFRTILFPCILYVTEKRTYRKVASSNTSRLEAHAGFFRLLMKEIFDAYILWPFDKKLIALELETIRYPKTAEPSI